MLLAGTLDRCPHLTILAPVPGAVQISRDGAPTAGADNAKESAKQGRRAARRMQGWEKAELGSSVPDSDSDLQWDLGQVCAFVSPAVNGGYTSHALPTGAPPLTGSSSRLLSSVAQPLAGDRRDALQGYSITVP